MTTPTYGEAMCAGGCIGKLSGNLPWFALRVRSRFEATAKQVLQGKEFETFFPSYQSRSYRTDRVKMVDRALFPGYVFCRFDPNNWLPVMKTPGVLEVVSFGGKPAEVDHDEVEALRMLMRSSVPLFPHAFLRVGQRVFIERGPLAGLEGILDRFDNNCRIVVSVSLLQRSVAAQIDAEWVRAID
jgi:transcription antitermination factor NusG